MSHHIHSNHEHEHGKNCGHTAIKHNDHVDYLHNGHLHHPHDDHVDEHVLEVNAVNPDGCVPAKNCGCVAGCGCGCESERCACECRADSDVGCHGVAHVHGENCGHEAIPHGDHVDYLVNGRLHHPHGDHCDDHGPVEVVH